MAGCILKPVKNPSDLYCYNDSPGMFIISVAIHVFSLLMMLAVLHYVYLRFKKTT